MRFFSVPPTPGRPAAALVARHPLRPPAGAGHRGRARPRARVGDRGDRAGLRADRRDGRRDPPGSTRPPTASSASTRSLPESERYVVAMSAAVQLSGLADRIGMAQSTQVVQTKTLDYFFNLRNVHAGRSSSRSSSCRPASSTSTSACSGRACRCSRSRSRSIVHAAIDTDRSIELDIVHRRADPRAGGAARDGPPRDGAPSLRLAINFTPASLLDTSSRRSALGPS